MWEDRPKLSVKNLRELKYKAVQPLTRESYDKLMKVTECMGLEIGLAWHWEDYPTEIDFFKELKGDVCVYIDKETIVPKEKEYFNKLNYNIITPEEFYKIQEITEDKFNHIDQWFEKNRPDRKSKGLQEKVI